MFEGNDGFRTAEMPVVEQPQQSQGGFIHNKLAMGAAGLVIAAGGTVLGLELTGGGSSTLTSEHSAALVKNADAACSPGEISFAPVSYGGNTDEILPSYNPNKVASSDTAANYSQLLFDHGPLGDKIDPGVEATIYAFMGYPATHKGGSVNEEQYAQEVSNAYSSMTSGDTSKEKTAASLYCRDNAMAVGETVGYSGDAIGQNATYTQITPKLNAKGNIDGVTAEEITSNHGQIAGVTYETNNQPENSSGLNSFDEVVVQDNGTVDILGLSPEPKPHSGKNNSQKNHGGKTHNNNNHNGQGTGHNGITSGGNHPEGQPGSTEHTPSTGPGSTTTPGTTSPGSTTTTPGTTTPETTTTAPPRSTTTTTTSPPATTTTTTAPSKGPAPPCGTNPFCPGS